MVPSRLREKTPALATCHLISSLTAKVLLSSVAPAQTKVAGKAQAIDESVPNQSERLAPENFRRWLADLPTTKTIPQEPTQNGFYVLSLTIVVLWVWSVQAVFAAAISLQEVSPKVLL